MLDSSHKYRKDCQECLVITETGSVPLEEGVSEANFTGSLEVIHYVIWKVLVSLRELRPSEFPEDIQKHHGVSADPRLSFLLTAKLEREGITTHKKYNKEPSCTCS